VNELGWNNVNNTCNYKDVVGYNVYYSPAVGNNYDLIASLNNQFDTVIRFEELISVAGCYAISAIDSFNNESGLSPRVCVDNCPVYELPNVFTPGGDGSNDIFHPIYPWRYVKNVDMVIFNRWGQVVFETDNPEINWNGINQTTNKPCPTGVYFYVCVVNEIRLAGIIPKELKGSITLMNQSDYKSVNAK
jgi:gliding motility-associated-like protein